MRSMRIVMMTAVVVVAFSVGWLAKTSAQQKVPAPLITYFSHEKVDASFGQALASTGSRDLFARKDRQGRTWTIHSNSRGKADEGTLHSAASTAQGPGTPHMYKNIEEPFRYLVVQTP